MTPQSLDGKLFMAEEAITAAPTPVSPAAEATPVVAAVIPAVETLAVVPVVEQAAPLAESTPVVEPAPVSEAPKPLLSPETPEAKLAEAEAPQEAPKAEAEPVSLPVYEFKLPEGAKADDPKFKAFTAKLGEFQNLTKAEQAASQKFGQELVDMHIEDVKAVVEKSQRDAWDWFNNRNKEWLETAKKDPQIGGEAFDATVSAASQAISLYGGTKAQQLETAKLLQETGVENHPALLRFLSNITKIAAKEGSPVVSQSTPATKFNPATALFGGTSKAS
jgi:hypothetical protein